MPELTAETAREILSYCPATGTFKWRERSPKWFSAEHHCRSWNTRYSGKPACTKLNGRGYPTLLIFKHPYLAHRVAWLIQTGDWPDGQVDHINGTRTDNRWVNLRTVSGSQNQRNSKRRSDNSSGITGVEWLKARKKWQARITMKGVKKHLGIFDTIEQAAAARKAAERLYGFHKNHGRENSPV